MSTSPDVLHAFSHRVHALLRQTWEFTLSLNNVVTYAPVSWHHKGLDEVPFSRAMIKLESELKELSEGLRAAQENFSLSALERLYPRVEPAFHVVFGPRERDAQLPADAISLYLEQQQVLLFTYSGRIAPRVRSCYQDIFFRQLTCHVLVTHPFLTRESLDRASDELKQYARDFLRAVQRMYETDVEHLFRTYSNLLLELHEVLTREHLRVPTYADVEPRRIAATGGQVVSNFIGAMRELHGLDEAQRAQILTLREADGGPESELFERLSHSRNWGDELPHVVAFLHQRNQDPLEKYTVFEAGRQGELTPVEIEEARSDQVVGQEENVARLRTLLTAFVHGSYMPFTLLEGEGGVGKTLSLQALVREIPGLKLVLISSEYLGQIREYAQKMAEEPWRTVLYIDDMTFDPRHYESFKIATQGMKTFYDNVTVMAAANPSSLQHLPPEVLRRWTIRLKYVRPNLADAATLRKVFKANCERVRVPCGPGLITAFRRQHKGALDGLPPSTVYDFLREWKVTHATEMEEEHAIAAVK